MPEWLNDIAEWLRALSWGEALLLSGVLFVVMFLGSIAAVACVLVRLPATYFEEDHHPHAFADRHPVIRWSALILKNVLGWGLIAIGIVLSLPGVPGQGFLTILIGLMLVNFPGKRRLERKLVCRPKVLAAVNRLRARFGKPPLVLDEED